MSKDGHVGVDLIAYICDELEEGEIRRVESHLESCLKCSNECRELRTIVSGISHLPEETDAVMEEMDWQKMALSVRRAVVFRGGQARRGDLAPRSWKIWAPILTSIFVLGLAVGYMLFHPGSVRSVSDEIDPLREQGMAMIERTLAKKEILAYLTQTQLLLTDMMGRCEPGESNTLFDSRASERIRRLLLRAKLFREELSDPRLVTSRYLLKRIEWLLYELLALEENTDCGHMERLQDVVRDERLFLKIRLVEKELNSYEV